LTAHYDIASNQWVPQCPYGDVCTGCDAAGRCSRAPRQARDERDPFADDVLNRLAQSNQDYQRAHGHYIVPLAERLLAAREPGSVRVR
jgi:hypothetical protein